MSSSRRSSSGLLRRIPDAACTAPGVVAAAMALALLPPVARAQDCVRYDGLTHELPAFSVVEEIVLDDIDDNGTQDLALLRPNVFGSLPGWVIPVRGVGGEFELGEQIQVGVKPTAVALGDLDDDGGADLVVTNETSHSLSLLLTDGLGGYEPVVTLVVGDDFAASAEVAELTGDRFLDIAVSAGSASPAVLVLPGLGDGTFGSALTTPLPGVASDIELLDVDGDQVLDLVVRRVGTVEWMKGQRNGSFGASTALGLSVPLAQLALLDVVGDALPDLLAVTAPGTLQVREALGGGTFDAPSVVQVALGETGPLRVADLDGDQALDLMLTSRKAMAVVLVSGGDFTPLPEEPIYPYSTFPVTQQLLGDLDGDGTVDLLELRDIAGADAEMWAGRGDGTFVRPGSVDLPTSRARDVALLHLDGDGWLDAVVLDFANDRLWTLLNAGDGGLQPTGTLALGDYPIDVAVADMDGDGITDVVVANRDSDDLSILEGHGDGTLAAAIQRPCGARPEGVALGDMSGDDLPDIAVSNHFANTVTTLRNLGGFSFTGAAVVSVGASPTGVVIADLDGNGWADLVTANQNAAPGNMSVVLRDTSGHFLPSVQYPTLNSNRELVVADINHDGLLDVVTSTSSQFFQAPAVRLMLGQPGGTFVFGTTIPQQNYAGYLALGDVDGDGWQDVVVGNGQGSVTWLQSLGSPPWLQARTRHAVLGACRGIALGDLDLDGLLDVVAVTDTSDLELSASDALADLTLLRNLCPPVWEDVGGGTTGINGSPTLVGSGSLVGGTPASVTLTNAPPNALLLAWISFAPTPFSAVGGTVHAFPFASQLFFTADASGTFTGATTWPTGVPSGTNVWFQFIVEDLSTIHGITLSNGLLATTP